MLVTKLPSKKPNPVVNSRPSPDPRRHQYASQEGAQQVKLYLC